MRKVIKNKVKVPDLSGFDDVAREKDETLQAAEIFVSRKQMNLIYALFGETGLDKSDFKIDSISKLTGPEARELIDDLIRIKDEHEYEDAEDDFEIGEDLPF